MNRRHLPSALSLGITSALREELQASCTIVSVTPAAPEEQALGAATLAEPRRSVIRNRLEASGSAFGCSLMFLTPTDSRALFHAA